MLIIKSSKIAFFDCDDTLIKWRPTEDEREEEGIETNWTIKSLSVDGETGKLVATEKMEEDAFIPISANVEQLKEHKRRGHTVVVWSKGGGDWAAMAVKMLGLEDYVDLSMDKPSFIYDDKQLEEFMPKVQFAVDEKPDLKKKVSKKEKAVRDDGEYGFPDEVAPTYGRNTVSAPSRVSLTRG